ncbi:MAG: hypothetical protein ABFQ82_06235 [Thermodesulfobacteriota bacterium]
MFKLVRIGVLLLILVVVAGDAWLTGLRNTDWDIPLEVVIYPVNGDGSEETASYIADLEDDVFRPVARYLASEGAAYQVELLTPVTVVLASEVVSQPPPAPFNGSVLKIMFWSLKLRWWAWRVDTYDGPTDIRIFVLYFDPARYKNLGHSLGLKEGRLCLVKAFADYQYAARNNVIITHELLHTLGATDKYDPETGQPFFPDGFADPDRTPLYPQIQAEIMGGLIPESEENGKMPDGLGWTVIGSLTAGEIGWTE